MRPEPDLRALEVLFDTASGRALPLPARIAELYGELRIPSGLRRPYVISNFITSLDGTVSSGAPGAGEGDAGSPEDRAVMGLLRAVSDAVILGAGTLRAWPRHLWTPQAIFRPLSADYDRLRVGLGKGDLPRVAIVTASGEVDPTLPVFSAGCSSAVAVTTDAGASTLASRGANVPVAVVGRGPTLDAGAILGALGLPPGSLVLLEGGPTLMGEFLRAGRVDELFLTLAPQIVGDSPEAERRGLAALAPSSPKALRAELLSVRRCHSLLFLRYRFPARSSLIHQRL